MSAKKRLLTALTSISMGVVCSLGVGFETTAYETFGKKYSGDLSAVKV